MALDTIVAAIAAEADSEVERITDEASRRVESILTEARSRSQEEQAQWEDSRAEETNHAVAGIVNRARLLSDRKVADVKEALFQEALGRLADRVRQAVAGSEYPGIFRALHAEAVAVVPDPDSTLLVRSEDVELALRIARDAGSTGAVKGVLECIGGLDVEADDGRSVRNTVDSRLVQSERPLRRLAVQVIPEMGAVESPT
jgi:vacuolar-type H+-ATPase subunit E/Vma4